MGVFGEFECWGVRAVGADAGRHPGGRRDLPPAGRMRHSRVGGFLTDVRRKLPKDPRLRGDDTGPAPSGHKKAAEICGAVEFRSVIILH